MDMENFTTAEYGKYLMDRSRLQRAWTKFKTLHADGEVPEPHWPQAVLDSSEAILNSIGANAETLDTETLAVLINFGGALFTFGQFCATKGLFVEAMQQCVCVKLRDTDITSLMGKNL